MPKYHKIKPPREINPRYWSNKSPPTLKNSIKHSERDSGYGYTRRLPTSGAGNDTSKPSGLPRETDNTRILSYIFSCDQAALWMVFSVCLSVCLSVRPSVRLSVTPFWLCSHHRIIMIFSGVITTDQGNVHAKGQGQRSKVKVTEVTTQLDRFRTVTPVWIHIWWWKDTYSLMLLRRGALLFFKVIPQISRSHGSKNRRIWPRLGVSGL